MKLKLIIIIVSLTFFNHFLIGQCRVSVSHDGSFTRIVLTSIPEEPLPDSYIFVLKSRLQSDIVIGFDDQPYPSLERVWSDDITFYGQYDGYELKIRNRYIDSLQIEGGYGSLLYAPDGGKRPCNENFTLTTNSVIRGKDSDLNSVRYRDIDKTLYVIGKELSKNARFYKLMDLSGRTLYKGTISNQSLGNNNLQKGDVYMALILDASNQIIHKEKIYIP